VIQGKGIFKEEFVTCGGVSLKEVDFKTMQSRVVENLFFVGEVLDIDGITGGFNFQSSWTTGWLAGNALG
jgi:predicted flavoprotein YhiN